MNEDPPRLESPRISAQHFDLFVRQVAEHFCELRKIRALLLEHRRRLASVREISSSADEMRNDWLQACDFMALKIIEGEEITLDMIDRASFPMLESVWLDGVKRFKAYYIWERSGQDSSEGHYFRACREIRDLLVTKPAAPIQNFSTLKDYIKTSYLYEGSEDRLDPHKPTTNLLIARKAQRIWETNRDGDPTANWYRARRYVAMFYENIIPAVARDDDRSIATILRAFEILKSKTNHYLIINTFESCIAIDFLNKDKVQTILKKPDLYNFSSVPLDDWPRIDLGHPSLLYDESAKQLIYWGVMSDAERLHLLGSLSAENHRRAIEELYCQSRLRPFEDMVL